MADLHNIVSPIAKATAAAPTISEADVAGLSIDLNGHLRVITDSSGGTQPISRTATYTNSSITSATGSSQQLLAANTARKALAIINDTTSTTNWVIDPTGGTAASGTPPGFTLAPGDTWTPDVVPLNKITGIGTASSKLIVLEG